MTRVEAMRNRAAYLKGAGTEECKQITLGVVPTQRDKLLDWLRAAGVRISDLQKKTVEDAIQVTSGEAKRVLELRQSVCQTSLAKLEKLPLAVCPDNTMKGLFKYHGATTGRYVSQGGFNMQNLPRGTMKPPQIAAALLDINSMSLGELVSSLRAVFAFEMSVVDYSQIEIRVYLWLAGDNAGLEDFRKGIDPYKTMAAFIYGIPYDQIRKDSHERQVGKTVVMGAGYQMGALKFLRTCQQENIPMTEEEAKAVIDTFRKKYSLVKKAWSDVDRIVKNVITTGEPAMWRTASFYIKNNYLWVVLPSGREITYRKPFVEDNLAWGGESIGYVGKNSVTKKWEICTTYGGSIFQSIVQGTARDLMTDAMRRMRTAKLDLRASVHDEIICQGDVVEEMRTIMLEAPAWIPDIPLEAKGWYGHFYHK